MKLTLISTIAAALFVAQATACAKSGQVCQTKGEKACGCGTGHLFQCGQGSNNLVWKDLGNCPSNPGHDSCVQGKCTL